MDYRSPAERRGAGAFPLRVVAVFALSVLAVACSGPASGPRTLPDQPVDIVIRGGRVIDGTGSPWPDSGKRAARRNLSVNEVRR